MDKFRTTLFYILAILIGALTLITQLSLVDEEEQIYDNNGAKHLPDYYIEGVSGVMYLEDGTRGYQIKTDRFVHFPDDNSALLDNPHIIQYVADESPRIVWSENGWMNGRGDEILLRNNVKIRQAPHEGEGGISADTAEFRVKLEGDEN